MKLVWTIARLSIVTVVIGGCSLVLNNQSAQQTPFSSSVPSDEYQRVEAEQLIKSGALVVDVRSPDEYSRGHLAQAVNIPYTQIRSRISSVAPDKSRAIVLYCQSGRRAEVAQEDLQDIGYSRVVNAGGLSGLRRE